MSRPLKPGLKLPHGFVVEALSSLHPEVRRLFSGFAVYSRDRLLLMVRESEKSPRDNGIWLVLSEGTNPPDESLREDLPSIRKIELLRSKLSHWLLIPSDDDRFENLALRVCDLILRHDSRFGRVPRSRR